MAVLEMFQSHELGTDELLGLSFGKGRLLLASIFIFNLISRRATNSSWLGSICTIDGTLSGAVASARERETTFDLPSLDPHPQEPTSLSLASNLDQLYLLLGAIAFFQAAPQWLS